MSIISVTVLDRGGQKVERQVMPGTTAAELHADNREVIAVRINGELRDLAHVVNADDVIEPVTIGSEDGLVILRHSCAHVLAQAVQSLFPEAKLGIGPPIEHGFYYDFDVARPFTPDDLKAIEQRMRQIVKQNQRFSRRVVTEDEAREELASEPYKLELVATPGRMSKGDNAEVEVGSNELTIYDNLDAKTAETRWKDLCCGPHVPKTKNIPAFKLTRTAASWLSLRGSSRGKFNAMAGGPRSRMADTTSGRRSMLCVPTVIRIFGLQSISWNARTPLTVLSKVLRP